MIGTLVRRTQRVWKGLKADSSLAMLSHVVWSKAFHRAPAKPPAPPGPANAATSAVRAPRTVPRGVSTASRPIPKTVFQTWKTRSQLPSNYSYWSSTFRTLNPEYEHVLWDDGDNREFIAAEFPWFLPYYDGYPREIFRADIVRLFFLFRFGGLYADLDTECLRPLDGVLADDVLVLGRMGPDTEFPHSVPNAMMASAPGQLFWPLTIAMAIERIEEYKTVERMRDSGPERLTGPILVKDAFDFYVGSSESAVRERAVRVLRQLPSSTSVVAGKIRLLEPAVWYPLDWNNAVHDLFRRELLAKQFVPSPRLARWLFPNSYLVTYWTHSW